VDKGSANVQTETQQPQNKQNNENSPKHVSLLADLSKLNLMKSSVSLTNDSPRSFSFPQSQVWSEKLGLGMHPTSSQTVRWVQKKAESM
jgi:hypothetical protein